MIHKKKRYLGRSINEKRRRTGPQATLFDGKEKNETERK